MTSTDPIPSGIYWERNSQVGAIDLLSSASGRTEEDLLDGTQHPVAGQVRLTRVEVEGEPNTEHWTVDAFLETRVKTKPFWPGETITCTVLANFLTCSWGGYTTAPSPVNYQRVIDRVGIVPFTNWFDAERIPKAALWCETGASQIVDSLSTGLLPMTGLRDRSRTGNPHPLTPLSGTQPFFQASNDANARRGDSRAYLTFNGQNQYLATPNHADFDVTNSEMLLALAVWPAVGQPEQDSDYIIAKRGDTSALSWWLRMGVVAGTLLFGVSTDGTTPVEITIPMPIGVDPIVAAKTFVIIIRTRPDPNIEGRTLVDAWINGYHIQLPVGTGFVGTIHNSTSDIVVGAKTPAGVEPFLGHINEVFFAPTHASDAAVACLMYEMLRRWGIEVLDHDVALIAPGNPFQAPYRVMKRNPIAEINCFGAGYQSGDPLTGQAGGWRDPQATKTVAELKSYLNTAFQDIKGDAEGEAVVFDIVVRLPAGRVAGDIMPSDPLAYMSVNQRLALREWIDEATEANGETPSFVGENPPRLLWVYAGCGLPYDYATDEYGYGALGSRTGSIMQNRVMAPITHESWYVEHNARWTSIHEKLVNYICDAASLQFRRFIGIAHDDSFRTTKMLILEAFLPVINHNYRQWAPFYSSLRFKQAPWFEQSANDLRFVCDPDPEGMLSNFTFYGTGGGNNAEQMVTSGCPTPGATPDAEHLYVDAAQVVVMKELGGPYPLIPLARPGSIPDPNDPQQRLSYAKMAHIGWTAP